MKTTEETQDYILFKIEDGRQLNFNETMELLKMLNENIVKYKKLPQLAKEQLASITDDQTLLVEEYQIRLEDAVEVEDYEAAAYYFNQINNKQIKTRNK